MAGRIQHLEHPHPVKDPLLQRHQTHNNIKYVNATRLGNEKVSSEKHYDATQIKPNGSFEVEAPNNQDATKDGYMGRQNLV